MLKVMCGIHRSDSGEMFIDGEHVMLHAASDAHAHGIAVVYQDLALVESLDISTNMALGNLPRKARKTARPAQDGPRCPAGAG